MKLEDYINPEYLDNFQNKYLNNSPFPHIVFDDFISPEIINKVEAEFPDLSQKDDVINFNDKTSYKFASKGFKDLSPEGVKLISFLNSDIFLEYLQELTGIKETLISDPYLVGGGYHEIKSGGFLKTHVDYTKHSKIGIDRRINLLLYLNKNWIKDWGGSLHLYDKNDLTDSKISIEPIFNRCVIFTTTSFTYHGHPDVIKCPDNVSRKSLALYYFSNGRPQEELSEEAISDSDQTFWIDNDGKEIPIFSKSRKILSDILPPIIFRNLLKFFGKK